MNNTERMVRSLYENFPEASSGSALQCIGWKYQAFKFNFIDTEDGKKYEITLPKAMKGFRILTKLVEAGELPGLGLTPDFKASEDSWDAYAIDALAQCAVFGEVIYG